MTTRCWHIRILLLLLPLAIAAGCGKDSGPGLVLDEAKRANRTVQSFRPADEDYFRDMDDRIELTSDEVKGRNTWIVWTGGNDRFWDRITIDSFGAFELLKTLSSHPSVPVGRDTRWVKLGLVNEPCFEKATGPDPQRWDLWLDKRRADCPADPFENETKYPGVVIGARGKTVNGKLLPVGSAYGWATGIVGLRLFPNPDFDDAAAKKWDARRFYEDPTYVTKELVRPYRVGMSCGFCHVGPNPVKPPTDPENPRWANLSSNVGAQYFWVDGIFMWKGKTAADNYMYQLLHTYRPGSLDTSLVSTDYINNPRTMNAVYNLGPRLDMGRRWGRETLAGGGLQNAQFTTGPLASLFQPPATVLTPRVLKDGADSVGPLGALNRVYLNIGLFSEEWLQHFRALSGGQPTTPIEISVARKNSVYWQVTEAQTPDTARFFLRASQPHRLRDAPGGPAYLTRDATILERGKVVFAERCARCHSSKLPTPTAGLEAGGCAGPGYLDCWNRYWASTKTDEFKAQMRRIVLAPDFLDGNYLSTEARVPVTLLETNACSPLATNALKDNIWDNFSSQSYKDLPSVGTITVHDPITGEPHPYKMPDGGRGYTRPASLISLWSTAPFLLNNTVGKFESSPAVEARMRSFGDAIEKMLWPEKRDKDPVLGDKVPGLIDRTDARSFIRISGEYLPPPLRPFLGFLGEHVPWLFGGGGIEIGPIPKDTPVGLIANLEIVSESPNRDERQEHVRKVAKLLPPVISALRSLPRDATDDQAREVFRKLVPQLVGLSKCPDFVVNRGHYFGTAQFKEEPGLGDPDKRALIEFLKTF